MTSLRSSLHVGHLREDVGKLLYREEAFLTAVIGKEEMVALDIVLGDDHYRAFRRLQGLLQ